MQIKMIMQLFYLSNSHVKKLDTVCWLIFRQMESYAFFKKYKLVETFYKAV